jgi:hypothetical protein
MYGHKISDENLKAARKHALDAKKHGVMVEKLAASLGARKQLTPEKRQFIAEMGRQIQEHAQASLKFAEAAQQDDEHSTEAYVQSGVEHAKAVDLHVKANQILLEAD